MNAPTATPASLPLMNAHAGSAPAPREIMYMPAGVHEITARQGGAPVTLRVAIDRTAAQALERSRAAWTAGKQRPFFDFDHEGKAASAWPLAFRWRDAAERPAGVYAELDWSDAGCAAVLGRTYRAFSPSFFVAPNVGLGPNVGALGSDASVARVTGAPLCMGGLVNDPAFEQMEPGASRHRGSQSSCQSCSQ